MTDITKCTGQDCPLAVTCYRFICEAAEPQSYIAGQFDLATGKCEMEWRIGPWEEERWLT